VTGVTSPGTPGAEVVGDSPAVADLYDLDDGPGSASRDSGAGRTLGRASLVNLVGFATYGLAGFGLVVVITRGLGPSGAGALLEAIAVFTIVSRSAMAGTDIALVRFTSRFLARDRHREVRQLYRVALGPVLAVSTVAAAALLVAAAPLGRLLASGGSEQELIGYLRVLAPFIPLTCVYQVLDGASRGFGTMVPDVAVERLGRSVAVPAVVFVVIAAGGGATAIGLAWAGPFALALVPIALWTTVLVRRAERTLDDRAVDGAPSAPDAVPVRELRRRFWSFALPRSFAGVFALTILWIDALLLGALEGTEAAGVYSAAVRWLLVGNIAGNAVTLALGPQIAAVIPSGVGADGSAGARRLFQTATAWFVLLAWPAYLVAIVFAPLLLTAFGDGFGDGAAVIAITGVGFLFASAAGPVDMLLLMAGRSRLSLINTGVALIVNVGANLALIPWWGIRGAATAWLLSLVVANGLPLVQVWRDLGIHPWGGRTLRALAITGVAGIALVLGRAVAGTTATGLGLGLILGAGVVVGGILLTPDRMGVDDVLGRSKGDRHAH